MKAQLWILTWGKLIICSTRTIDKHRKMRLMTILPKSILAIYCKSACFHFMCFTNKFNEDSHRLFVYVIAWLGVKFGINFTSVVVRMAKIARGEAECNFAILTTTQVKFIPKFHS